MRKILILLVSLIILVSCAQNSQWSLKAGDTTLSKGSFYAQAVTYKNDFLQSYLGITEDFPEIWDQSSPEKSNETVGQSIMRMAIEDMAQFVWVIDYAKSKGITLTDEEKKSIDDSYNELKAKFDTEEAFNDYVNKLGIDDKELKEHLESTLFYDKGFNELIAEDGLYPVTDEDLWNYFEENFYTIKHIYFNNVNTYASNDSPIALTDEQKEEKMQKALKIIEDLDAGGSFDVFYILSEDGASTSYPNGMTFGVGLTTDASYEAEVMNMEIGEYKLIEPDNGGIYVTMRVPLDENAVEEYEDFIFSAVCQEISEKIYNDHKDEIEVNFDYINSLDIKTFPVHQ